MIMECQLVDDQIPAVYLIHFEPAYKHARHYLGSTNNILKRIHRHSVGSGANIVRVALDAGCNCIVSRIWWCETDKEARKLEKKLKNRHSPKLCPICKSGGSHENG